MKLSLNWIKEYVSLPAELTLEQLMHDLTMSTVEVESMHSLKEQFDKMVVGRILSVSQHPRADKLRIVSTDIGSDKPVTIVCGGSNLEPEQRVAVALPGSFVRWHGLGEPVEIKCAPLRGVESYGMICAAEEIFLGDLLPSKDDTEIINLDFTEADPGSSLAEVLDMDDIILEIDNKSLTNRPDLWGHYGVARELSAIYNAPLRPLEGMELPDAHGIDLYISDPACRRFTALTVENIANGQAPFWMQNRLYKVGMRPIDLLVDVTNYVMLTTGQPVHGYDYEHVAKYIDVRKARAHETLELLSGEVLDLSEDDLLISDAKGAIGLAGIMGGKGDSIFKQTNQLIFEAANFDPTTVRRTTQKFGLRTEASTRFEKSLETGRTIEAVQYFMHLMHTLQPEVRFSGFSDVVNAETQAAEVSLSYDFLNRRLGRDVDKGEVNQVLTRLGFRIEDQGETMHLVAPLYRSTGDIELPDDILEEVARLIGYEHFHFVAPSITLTQAVKQKKADLERAVREFLAFRIHAQEIFTYPWVSDQYIEAADLQEEMLALSTPPAPNMKNLRVSLVPGLIESIALNLHHFSELRLFEMTQVFKKGTYSPNDPSEVLPCMPLHAGGAFVGNDALELFREVKGMLEVMPRIVQCEGLSFAQLEKPGYADPKLWLNILSDGQVIGHFGLLNLRAVKAAGIKRAHSVLFELNVSALKALISRENTYRSLPEYPLVEQDLTIDVDESIGWQQVVDVVAPMVNDVQFVSLYRGEVVGQGKKSLSLRIWMLSKDGTMTMEQIERRKEAIEKQLTKRLGAKIRGLQ